MSDKRLTIAVLLALVIVGGAGAHAAPPAPVLSAPEYDLTVRVLPDAHRLEASGTVRLASAASAQESLRLQLSELMHDFIVEILEPAASAGPALLEKGETKSGTTEWIVHPPHPIAAGEPVRLRFSYAGGEKTAFVFYLGPEGSFAGGGNTAWYPQLKDNDAGTGTLRLNVPAGYTATGAGVRQSTPADEARGDFRFVISQPLDFSFTAARYTVLRRAGRVPVAAYLLHARPNVDAYLDGCAKVLDFLTHEFGPYPYPGFALIEVPTEQAGKAGFSGAGGPGFILSDSLSLDKNFSLAFYAHEVGHMWWGNLITVRGARGRYLLSEGMAQYGSLLAVEAIEGADAAERYRRTGYPGYGTTFQSGLGYLKLNAAGLDYALASLPEDSTGSDSFYRGFVSHELADGKGFLALDLLSRTVGRDRFRKILQDFTMRHAFRAVSWEDFVAAAAAGAGTDVSWFFSQWFGRTGAPDWQLTWTQDGKTLRGAIVQSAPYYRARVELAAEGDDGGHATHEVEIDGARTEFSVPAAFTVRSLVLDPHYQVLHWTPEYRSEAVGMAPYYRASVAKTFQTEGEFKAALRQVPSPDPYGLRFWMEYGRALVLWDQNKLQDAKAHFEAALASPVRVAKGLPRLYLYLATVARDLKDEKTMRSAAEAAIAADAANEGKTGVADEARALPTPNP